MESLPPSERLASVLAAASAPPEPHEFAGEEAALAAFRARSARRRFSLRRAVGVKITVVVTMTVAAGGVAAAKILPSPFAVPIVAPPQEPPVKPHRPEPEPPLRSEVTASPAARPRATLSAVADHGGLCRQFLAKAREERRRALQTPEYAPLVAAAGGGLEAVLDFCAKFAERRPTPRPSRPARPRDVDERGNAGGWGGAP